ncbi:prepilin peptidase [Vallitalea okinawensis]|uniref:prepilin peptidase n=1 Tax=Vallitalea okinawensis TaxID=2078660 RepID=UPI000CFC3671|nr:A24 family peptidase [Vallitalea okinawensis]
MTIYLFIFILGLVIGSFLNVCIYRIPSKESIANGRSKCPHCQKQLKFYDLIPFFSYILLKGRCRFCKKHITIQYPLVELLTGIEFILFFYLYGLSIDFFAVATLCCILNVVFFIDLKHMIIPNKVVLFGLVIGLVIQGYHIITGNYGIYLGFSRFSGFIAIVLVLSLLILIYILSLIIYKGRAGIGMGDIKLYIPLGLFLGWPLTLISLWFAVVIGGVVGVVLLSFVKIDRKSMIPFGPFIVIGVLIALIFGEQIVNYYL